jgi:hypothetical protein
MAGFPESYRILEVHHRGPAPATKVDRGDVGEQGRMHQHRPTGAMPPMLQLQQTAHRPGTGGREAVSCYT